MTSTSSPDEGRQELTEGCSRPGKQHVQRPGGEKMPRVFGTENMSSG